jgi:hypothetical protein
MRRKELNIDRIVFGPLLLRVSLTSVRSLILPAIFLPEVLLYSLVKMPSAG